MKFFEIAELVFYTLSSLQSIKASIFNITDYGLPIPHNH